jgi:hypothetical protein
MRLFGALLLLAALVSPAMAQNGAGIAAGAKDAAQELQSYLNGVAKAGGRPDFSKAPASALLGRIFDLKHLAALPPLAPNDMPWLLQWSAAASQGLKSIMYFGITPPATIADRAAIEHNLVQYEDEEAEGMDFLIRIMARQIAVCPGVCVRSVDTPSAGLQTACKKS